MDSVSFDDVSRLVGSGLTRRGMLRGLVAGAAALTGADALLHADEATARRRRKHKTRRSHQDQGTCGRQDDGCGALDENGEYSPPYCCHGYYCHYDPDGGTWTCQPE
jgi:hypothetical protein